MIARNIRPRLLESLTDAPVVFLRGPRQTGKTTLVQSLVAEGHRARYLTLDDSTVLAAAGHDPDGFIRGLTGPVILDEVQRIPALFLAIKAAVDRDRQPGRFLLTGSADVLLLPQAADALVGRMALHTLWPFSQGEVSDRREDFIEAVFRETLPERTPDPITLDDLADRLTRGGYPEAVHRPAPRRAEWFGSYLNTILQRDIRDLARITGLTDMPRLLAALAARSGQLVSYSDLSRELQLPQTTLKRYVALLEAALLYRSIPAWSANVGKRLAKAPKAILCDPGLACHLLGADAGRVRADSSLLGPLTESFAMTELMKQQTWSRRTVSLHHYRTHGQKEVDAVLEARDGRLVGIEVKSGTAVRPSDLSGLHDLAKASGDRFVRGVLLYLGEAVVPFGPRLHAVPLQALWAW